MPKRLSDTEVSDEPVTICSYHHITYMCIYYLYISIYIYIYIYIHHRILFGSSFVLVSAWLFVVFFSSMAGLVAEVSLLYLMECMRSGNHKELAGYSETADGAWVAKTLKLILHLAERTEATMKPVGTLQTSLATLSIQDECLSADAPLADDRDESFLSPKKRRGTQDGPIDMDVGENVASEPLLVLSPSKRLCGKQQHDLVLRRNPKYCQRPDCVFSRSMPGEACWTGGGSNCVWCDPDAMARALEGGPALTNLRVSLSIFKKKNTAVHERALALLPTDFLCVNSWEPSNRGQKQLFSVF